MFSIYLQFIQANRYLCLILHSSRKKLKKKPWSTNVIIGLLEEERAGRLIHNYNLIFNLYLSPQRIDQALTRFGSGENVILKPALRYLKELWKQACTGNGCFFHLPFTWTYVSPQSEHWGRGFVWAEADVAVLVTFDLDLYMMRSCLQ